MEKDNKIPTQEGLQNKFCKYCGKSIFGYVSDGRPVFLCDCGSKFYDMLYETLYIDNPDECMGIDLIKLKKLFVFEKGIKEANFKKAPHWYYYAYNNMFSGEYANSLAIVDNAFDCELQLIVNLNKYFDIDNLLTYQECVDIYKSHLSLFEEIQTLGIIKAEVVGEIKGRKEEVKIQRLAFAPFKKGE